MTNARNAARLLLCFASTIALTSPAFAQSAPAGADNPHAGSPDIVVTATRRSEQLKDVPQSIAAFSSDMLESRGIDDINSLGRQTPGLVLNERSDRTPNVVMRGVGSFGNVQGVGFYIDDVQNFTDQTMRLQDIERVEILKGPQGTLYGGSSIGGAIRYITKEPGFETGAEVQAEAGEKDYLNLYASINAPLTDKVAARLSGYYSSDDGFITSPTIPDIGHWKEYGLRGQVLLKPSDRLTALFTVRYRKFDGALALDNPHDGVSRVNYVTDLSFRPNTKLETVGVVAKLGYEFDGAALEAISSFTRQERSYLIDPDYSAAPIVAVIGEDTRPVKVMTQELRLTSTSDGALKWIAGLYAARMDNIQIIGSPLDTVFLGTRIPNAINRKSQQTDLAAFASADLRLGDLTVSGGLRLYNVDYDAVVYSVAGQPTFDNDATVILPRVSLSYATAGGTNLYASIAKGYEPGKASVGADVPFDYRAEKTWAFEAGAKGSLFDPSLYFELAGFYTLYQDREFENRFFDTDGVVLERIDNIGDSEAYGFEGSLVWRPTKSLALNGALGYLHARWKKGTIYSGTDIAGRTPPNSPAWTANLGATYSAPLSKSLKFGLHVDATYMDQFQWTLDYNPISGTNPAYWTSFAKLSVGDIDDRWSISAQVRNLFNTRYYTQFYPEFFGVQGADGTCDKCHLGLPGERQRIVVSFSAKF